jgi:formylglycine-generating enzyme required for sulfatase activity
MTGRIRTRLPFQWPALAGPLAWALILALGLAPLAGRGLSAAPAAEEAAGGAMVAIPAGSYLPLYSPTGVPGTPVAVAAFRLDAYAVTNAQFLAFVRAQPRWQRSAVPRLFADARYLEHWSGDTALGETAPARSPVTHVSWFAARAYCAWRGARLPTTDEWEYAAAASERAPPGTERGSIANAAFRERILQWYAQPVPAVPPPVGSIYRNLWGVYDLHGLVWEWTLDFNTALVTGESRQDSDLERKLYCGPGALGATDPEDYAAFMRHGFRSSLRAEYTVSSLGFRCAAPAAPAR